jgi:hypothetical protein
MDSMSFEPKTSPPFLWEKEGSFELELIDMDFYIYNIPKYGLFLMNDSSKDIAQQCGHRPSYKIPE